MSRIFFETACFIAFLLIAHGYCVMHEQLSVSERRGIAGLASLLYLTLTGYKAAVPQFAVSPLSLPVLHYQLEWGIGLLGHTGSCCSQGFVQGD